MAGHGHGHGPGGGHCEAESHEEDAERGVQYGLFLKIDRDRLECLNEQIDGSGKQVFRPWDERNDRSRFVESDADEELLFNIPFTGNVKLKGIVLIGGEDESHPAEMRLFKNLPHMSFDDTTREPDQVFGLQHDDTGLLEYPTKVNGGVVYSANMADWEGEHKPAIARFSSVYHLSIHISRNFGAEATRIYYIGLRGEWMQAHQHKVTLCTYEASANPADHKVDLFSPQTHYIS